MNAATTNANADNADSTVDTDTVNTESLSHADALGNEIATLAGHIAAASYRLLVLIRQFDDIQGWAEHGAQSCAHWLNWRIGLGMPAAREKVRVARALAELPKISAHFERGQVSYSKVRAMSRIANAENEEGLLAVALHGTAAHVEGVVSRYRRCEVTGDESGRAERQYAERCLRTYTDHDGALVIEGRLPPEAGAIVRRALDLAGEALLRQGDVSAETRSPGREASRRGADALVYWAESTLERGVGPVRGGRHEVVVHVDHEALADPNAAGRSEIAHGPRVSAETSRRLACDGRVTAMLRGADGEVLSVGRRSRAIPAPMRRALKHRDQGCKFPGCSNRFTDGHHIEHWVDGGQTKLANLAELCRHHHRLLHEGGFRMRALDGGELEFRDRFGRVVTSCGSTGEALAEELVHWHQRRGVHVDDRSLMPQWDGEVVDYDEVVAELAWSEGRPQLAAVALDQGGGDYDT